MCKPAGEDEPRTVGLTVTPEMTPHDVVARILGQDEKANTPWKDGNYKADGGIVEQLVLTKEKAVPLGQDFTMTFKYGDFGKASEKITEMSGEKNYTVEVRLEAMGREFVDHGVLLEGEILEAEFCFFFISIYHILSYPPRRWDQVHP